MSDTGDDYVEEEFMVFADFQTKLSVDVLSDPETLIKIIGFEDQNPIMQVNEKMFQGTFDYSIGTNAFFAEDPNPPPRLQLYETEPEVVYKLFATSDKVLVMNRMFVERKDDGNGAGNSDSVDEAGAPSIIPINKSYAMALNQFLQPGELPPRTLDDGSDRFYKKYRTDGEVEEIDGNKEEEVE